MSSLIGVRAHDYGKRPAGELLRAIFSGGWQAVQLAFPKAVAGVASFADVTPPVVEEVKNALQETGLSVAVLGVYVEPSLVDDAAREADDNGILQCVPFHSSVVDHQLLFSHLRKLDAPILREMAVPTEARKDIEFIKTIHIKGEE